MKNKISELFDQYGLGKLLAEPSPLSGGLMHRMYKVQAETGTYAVKCLNPQIMKRPGVFENYARAEKLEDILEEEGLPIVPALTFELDSPKASESQKASDARAPVLTSKKMLECEGDYFYIFRWQEGNMAAYDAITEEECRIAGELLGRIHIIDAQNIEARPPVLSQIDFDTFLHSAEEKSSCIAPLLRQNLELLKDCQEKLNQARTKLPAMNSISNDDMDPKNIIWHKGQPHIIDLECLDYTNPISSSLNQALQWSGTVSRNFKKEKLAAFYRGYLAAYDNGFRSYDQLFGIAYSWLEWLEYNIRRGLGQEVSRPEEIRLGEEEVKNTIERIKYLNKQEEEISSVLEGLPAPYSKNYKTHDDSLCYIDLFFEGELSDIPSFPLPEGYRFVTYKSGDKAAWIDIELSAEEILSRQHGEECWQRYYGKREDELAGRMFFIESKDGQKVATATAFYNIHTKDKSEGQLHWVAVKKEEQGKGLSKPLITFTLEVMKKLGYRSTKIPTQTNTWLACKIYHDLGFRPTEKSLKENSFGWKMVQELTGITFG
ncbi:MAG: GNAT family N-acetyltransferase [Treponemataceae bacterium]|nr:GNAT family N-acetyltransferase [Treponemataceae bacterium]